MDDYRLLDVDKVAKLLDGFMDVISVYRLEDDVNLLEAYQAVKSLCVVLEETLRERFNGIALSLEPQEPDTGVLTQDVGTE